VQCLHLDIDVLNMDSAQTAVFNQMIASMNMSNPACKAGTVAAGVCPVTAPRNVNVCRRRKTTLKAVGLKGGQSGTVMVSNILPPYDFSDLQIISKCESRSGNGRFLTFLPCLVTNRTVAGRRLYLITTADAVRCLVGVFKDRPGAGRFYTDEQIVTRNDVYVKISVRHHASKETVCQKKKD